MGSRSSALVARSQAGTATRGRPGSGTQLPSDRTELSASAMSGAKASAAATAVYIAVRQRMP